jgi:GNAT superfamily N-acetyltransferase
MADIAIQKHYMLEMRLELSAVDTDGLAAFAGRMDDLGLVVSTLEREANPDAGDRAYHCHMACRLEQPPTVLRREPIPFARWREGVLTGPTALPDASFLAKAGDEYVGLCLLHRAEGRPDALVCGFTGTLPAWSGRGVATALKAHALLHAARQGWRSVETSVLQVNRGMCAINRALGFRVVRRRLHTYALPPGSR